MKRYSQHQIEALLTKFMDGQTTVEEEALLADYFRTHDVPAEWEDYRDMFGYFDRGMEGDLVPVQQPQASLTRLMGRRWWGIAAAACITAAIVATAVLRDSSTTTPEQPAVIAEAITTPSSRPLLWTWRLNNSPMRVLNVLFHKSVQPVTSVLRPAPAT